MHADKRSGTGTDELHEGLEQILRETEAIIGRVKQPGEIRQIAGYISEIRVSLTKLRDLHKAGRLAYTGRNLSEIAVRFLDLEGRVKELRNDRESLERMQLEKTEERACKPEKRFWLWTTTKRLLMFFARSSKPAAMK